MCFVVKYAFALSFQLSREYERQHEHSRFYKREALVD
jgi:hypothetical protein